MKGIIKYSIAVFTITLAILSCQKQIDYGPDIALLKSDVASLKSSITAITAQLTSLEASLKAKIDLTNAKIDTINTAINTLNTKTITGLTADILAINNSVKNTNAESTKRLDSIRNVILKIDTSINVTTPSATSLSESYNKLLSNYIEILKIIKETTTAFTISGKIEKGPFSKGAIISFYELDSNLSQTGRSFSTTIDDNEGNYDLKATNIGGRMFRVQTDGFYYNEILNSLSTSRIVLTGISKVDSSEKINVNVLTHIERRRVEYLMNIKKLSFDSAKKQSITELLGIFKTKADSIIRSEKVSLFGDNNDVLLNISLLFQGYRTDAQLSELLTDFSNDFYKDGTIEDTKIFKKIYNHSYFVDTLTVAKSVKEKFNVDVKSFSILNEYLKENTANKDENYMPIIYPQRYNNKKNFLTRIATETISKDTSGCFIYVKNDIPSFDFKVIVKSVNPTNGSGLGSSQNVWFYSMGSGWSVTNFQFDNFGNQTFYTNNPIGEVSIQFGTGQYDLYFFEPSASKNATFIKRLIVN
jgi:hypothetical protein